MALENLESVSDPFPLDSKLERTPDSSPLRVSLSTQFENGIPPARLREVVSLEGGIAHLELALAGVTRSEASLGLLIRGLKHLAAGAIAAREANTELSQELDALRTHLARSGEEEQALRFGMAQLERLLEVIRHETARERAFLVEQQDAFLVEILSDHDRQLADLGQSLKAAAAHTFDARRRELDELTAERDQAREYAARCERERDAAWQELAASETIAVPISAQPHNRPVAPTTRRPTSPELPDSGAAIDAGSHEIAAKPSSQTIGSISLRPVQVPAMEASSAGPEPTLERTFSGAAGYSISRKGLTD